MMPAKPPAGANRRPYCIAGGILLLAILVLAWFWDDLGHCFETTPKASAIEGSWVFDEERARELLTRAYGNDQQLSAMRKRYGDMKLTFAPGAYIMDAGDGKAAPAPCAIQGYPPDAFVVTTGIGKNRREYVFQFNADKTGKHLLMCTADVMAPFKPSE